MLRAWLSDISVVTSFETFLPPNICNLIFSFYLLPDQLWIEMLEILATHVHPSARVATTRALAPGKLSSPSHPTVAHHML